MSLQLIHYAASLLAPCSFLLQEPALAAAQQACLLMPHLLQACLVQPERMAALRAAWRDQ